MVTKDLMTKNWPLYRVCTQHRPGDEVVIRKIKADGLEELHDFVRRLCCVQNCTELSIYEVTEDCVNTTTGELVQKWHVGNPNAQWPLGTKMRQDNVIYSPRVETRLPRELPPPPAFISGAKPGEVVVDDKTFTAIVMPPVQNRELASSTERGPVTNVREIARRVAEQREEKRKQYDELARPMRRLKKKVA